MSFIDELRAALAPAKMRLLSSRMFQALMSDEKAPIDLWRVYLWESYHYVKHNGINQALAVLRTPVTEKRLMIRYLKHALEEIDHDEMCLRDLEKLGVAKEVVIASRPLPETAAFASFLYDFVQRDNPIGRLGYSFWAEGFNEESGYIVSRLRYHFGLPDSAMSFVVAHSHLDEKHGAECVETIERFAKTDADREAIKWFGVATCHQFFYVLEAMYDRYLRETGRS
jgi:pyrroloquinoline quinone (PQQ) biosynthesis protein C